MPELSEVEEKVKRILADQLGFGPLDIKDSDNIVTDLDADSLDVVELVMSLEEAFDIEIPDADAQKLATVRDVIDYIAKVKAQ